MKRKLLLSVGSVLSVGIGTLGIVASAASTPSTVTITGHAQVVDTMPMSDLATFKKNLLDASTSNPISSVTQPVYNSFAKDGIKFSKAFGSDATTQAALVSDVKNFISNRVLSGFDISKASAGTFSYDVTMANSTVTIGNQTVTADGNGNFTFSLAPGTYPVTVSLHGMTMDQENVTISPGQSTLILSGSTTPSLISAHMSGMNMSGTDMAGMDMSGSPSTSNTTSSSGASSLAVLPQLTTTGALVGGTTHGDGTMRYVDQYNHVTCNKSWNDQGDTFPNNSSDCAVSVSQGMVYEEGGSGYQILNPNQYDSTFCVTEGMNAILNKEHPDTNNPYCNGQINFDGSKQGVTDWYINGIQNIDNQGYNCSSFPDVYNYQGRGDSEQLNHW